MKKESVLIFVGLFLMIFSTGLIAAECIDSDGGANYYAYGYVQYGGANYTDSSWIGANGICFVEERYCENGVLNYVIVSCPDGCDNLHHFCLSPSNNSSNCTSQCAVGEKKAAVAPEEYNSCEDINKDGCGEWSIYKCPCLNPADSYSRSGVCLEDTFFINGTCVYCRTDIYLNNSNRTCIGTLPDTNTTQPPSSNITNTTDSIQPPLSSNEGGSSSGGGGGGGGAHIPTTDRTNTDGTTVQTTSSQTITSSGGEAAPTAFNVNSQESTITGSNGIIATSTIALSTADGKAYATKRDGNKQEIKVDPASAIDSVQEAVKAAAVNEIKITEYQNKVVYEVNAIVQVKVIALVPAQMTVKANVNAEDGNIINVEKPWWSFLVKNI